MKFEQWQIGERRSTERRIEDMFAGDPEIAELRRLLYLGEIHKLRTALDADLMDQAQFDNHIADLLVLVEHEALQDELTGLPNRKAMSIQYKDLAARMLDSGLSVFTGLIDLDHFKDINTKYEHEGGDRALENFAKVLTDSLDFLTVDQNGDNKTDIEVGRFWRPAGEEFVGLYGLQNPNRLSEVIHMLGHEVADKVGRMAELRQGRKFKRVTFSGGFVQLKNLEEIQKYFSQADTLLFRAKASGRQRVFIQTEESLQTVNFLEPTKFEQLFSPGIRKLGILTQGFINKHCPQRSTS